MNPTDLRSRRLRAGCSREQLAHAAGIAPELLRAWEEGTAPMTCPRAIEQLLRQREEPKFAERLPRAS